MKDGMKNGYFQINVRFENISSLIMGDAESDEHLRIFKCLIDTGSHVLRNAIGIKLLNNNSITFVQYLENNKHQFYHLFEKKIWRKCCLGSPHGCVFTGTMDKKIFNKMYNKTAEHNTQDCLDRFETNAGISLDVLDLSDLNFLLWNSSTLSALEENSLMKIMSIRSAICHPPSSQSYSIDKLERYWRDLKSAVVLFAEPKCYKDIVEMQVETLQNCKLNVIESAKVIEKMKRESEKILHAIQQVTPLKIDDVEKLIKDGNCGLEKCVKSENNKTKSYIKEVKENIEKQHEVLSTRCREEIQTTVTQESSNTRLHSEDQRHAIETKLTDLMEENRKLTGEVMDVKTEIKELTTILIGYIGKQKVDLVMNTEQIENSAESPDEIKLNFTAKVNQTHVTEDKEKEIIEKLPPEVKIQTNNESLPDAAVTETIEITGKKVNSIILELKATPGILHSVENFKAAILTLVQVMQTAGGIDVDIAETITINLKFESPLTGDQFAVVKRLFAKEWSDDNDTTQLSDEYSSISDEYLSTGDVEGIEFRPELDTYSQKETSYVVQPETIEALTKPSCKYCDDKDKIIRTLEEQNEKVEMFKSRNEQYMSQMINLRKENSVLIHLVRGLGLEEENSKLKDLQEKNNQLEHVVIGLQEENSNLKALLRLENTGMISVTEKLRMKQKEVKSDDLSSLEPEQKYYLRKEDNRLTDSSSTTTLYECRHCYEKNEIIIQLDRRLCEIRRRIIEAKGKSLSGNNLFEDLLTITHQNTSMTSVEDKGRMKDKELKSDISSQISELIYDSDVRNPETKAKMNLVELQHSKVPGAGLDQPEDKSELSLRISELRRDYARNSYTKTEEQKGLAIILHRDSTSHFSHLRDAGIPHLQEFFEEMGIVVKDMVENDILQLNNYMLDRKVYCVFIVFGCKELHQSYLIRSLLHLESLGIPIIVMTDYTSWDFEMMNRPDTLLLSPLHSYIGPYSKLGRKARENNIFDDFTKVTRCNRYADIMDILTRMNSLYDLPVIKFQSSLRKKFFFL